MSQQNESSVPEPTDREFQELRQRIRQHDSNAIATFVATYRPLVVEQAERLLVNNPLLRDCGPSDVAQSVVVKALAIMEKDYPIQGSNGYRSLLMVMTKRKIISLGRKYRQKHRQLAELANDEGFEDPLSFLVDENLKSPSSITSEREQVDVILDLMQPFMRRVFELKAEGKSWNEIGSELGKPAHNIRVNYSREIDRIAKILMTDENDEHQVSPRG